MFIHRAKFQIRQNSFTELSKKIQNEIMPLLHTQKGFCRGFYTTDTIWSTAIENTHWETKEDVENYQQYGYFETLKILSGMVMVEPVISMFEVNE